MSPRAVRDLRRRTRWSIEDHSSRAGATPIGAVGAVSTGHVHYMSRLTAGQRSHRPEWALRHATRATRRRTRVPLTHGIRQPFAPAGLALLSRPVRRAAYRDW